jgi:hypothetical protein
MPNTLKKMTFACRRRQKQRGGMHLEIHVLKDAGALIREVVKTLSDPARATEARTLLRERLGAIQEHDLKELLAVAPLEGIVLTRERHLDREEAPRRSISESRS